MSHHERGEDDDHDVSGGPLVGLKVSRQVSDALSQECDLDLWRTGVTLMGGISLHEFRFAFCSHCHFDVSLLLVPAGWLRMAYRRLPLETLTSAYGPLWRCRQAICTHYPKVINSYGHAVDSIKEHLGANGAKFKELFLELAGPHIKATQSP